MFLFKQILGGLNFVFLSFLLVLGTNIRNQRPARLPYISSVTFQFVCFKQQNAGT